MPRDQHAGTLETVELAWAAQGTAPTRLVSVATLAFLMRPAVHSRMAKERSCQRAKITPATCQRPEQRCWGAYGRAEHARRTEARRLHQRYARRTNAQSNLHLQSSSIVSPLIITLHTYSRCAFGCKNTCAANEFCKRAYLDRVWLAAGCADLSSAYASGSIVAGMRVSAQQAFKPKLEQRLHGTAVCTSGASKELTAKQHLVAPPVWARRSRHLAALPVSLCHVNLVRIG